MRKRFLALGLATLMAMSITACGNSDNSSSSGNAESETSAQKKQQQDLQLVESGYSISGSDSDIYLNWGATVKNPNEDDAMEFPTITITAKDANGKIITTEDQTLMYIAPGDTVSYGFVVDCNGQRPETVEIKPESGDFVDISSVSCVASSELDVSNISEIKGSYDDTNYTGEIENKSDTDLDSVAVTILCKKDDKIVYGTTTFVDDLKSGDKKAFEVSEYNVPEHDSYEISAQSW